MWLFKLFFLNSANLICQGKDISKYFRESLGIRDNKSTVLRVNNDCLVFYIPFNMNQVLLRQWKDEWNGSVQIVVPYSHELNSVRPEPGTSWLEVGSANHSATQTLPLGNLCRSNLWSIHKINILFLHQNTQFLPWENVSSGNMTQISLLKQS